MSCISTAGDTGNEKWQVSVLVHLPIIKPKVDCPGSLATTALLGPATSASTRPKTPILFKPGSFLGLSHVDAHTDIGIFKCLASRLVLPSCGHAAINSDPEALRLLSRHAPSTYARQT